MKITAHGSHRGFAVGFTAGRHGLLPAWKSSLEREWKIGHVYTDDEHDALQLACECVDHRYRIEAAEAFLGRSLTQREMIELGPEP